MKKKYTFQILPVLLILLALLPKYAQGTIRYVKAGGTGTGTSWATASGDLQLTINNSNGNDTIWVAEGTYKPIRIASATNTITPNNRDNSFVMKPNVKVFGGFPASGNPDWAARNWITYPTILSGDIGTLGNKSDNCYHVVVIADDNSASTSVLDGFTISDGAATSNGYITVDASVVGFSHSIQRNHGGGINCYGNINNISNCIIINNETSFKGGGVCLQSAISTFANCSFVGNSATIVGGAIYSDGASGSNVPLSLRKTNLINSKFTGNKSNLDGGALGYGIVNFDIINCTFDRNQAQNGGFIAPGAASTSFIPIIKVKNSIVWRSLNNGSVSNVFGSPGYSSYPVTFDVNNSIIQDTLFAGIGNSTANPQFVNPISSASVLPSTDMGNYSLHACSPAINAGNNSYVPAGINTDIEANVRIVNTTVDMGAYEFEPLPTIQPTSGIVYVDSSKATSGNGSSWANATKELADALKAARLDTSIHQVWVAKGTYLPLYDAASGCAGTNPRNKSFVLLNNVKVYGGFAGNETLLSQRNWITNPTIMSGNIGIAASENDNSYHVLIIAKATGTPTVDGFIIRDGFSNTGGSITTTVNTTIVSSAIGGGVHINNTKAAIANCIIMNNKSQYGGGMSTRRDTTIVTNCQFKGNAAEYYAGGAYNEDGSSKYINCLFTGNKAQFGGGSYNFEGGSSEYINCTYSRNEASFLGGAARINDATGIFKNCIMWDNMADNSTEGSIAVVSGSTISVTYSTVQGATLFAGVGNSNANPMFIAPLPASTVLPSSATGNYRLHPCGSPALNVGSNAAIPTGITTDIEGNVRIFNATVDMGAYEVQQLNMIYDTLNESICTGDSYFFNGQNNTLAGQYFDTLLSTAGCDSIVVLKLTVNPHTTATINQSICAGQSYTFNGQTYTTSQAGLLDTFVNANGCDSLVTLNLTVTPAITHTINPVICAGGSYVFNGVTYTSPQTNIVHTFSNANGCDSIVTMNLAVTANTVPLFAVINPICIGSTAPVLPLTSTNNVTGTWSPATVNNMATGTYTFTPTAGQCATTATLTVTVNNNIIPSFTQVAAICAGSTASVLPLTSTNNITGTWSPATVSNTATATYTFTPTPVAGSCAVTATMTVTVNPILTSNFAPVAAICAGSTAPVLPATSTNGISGTWNPATVSNTTTGTYTFTPNSGQCGTTATLSVTVNHPPAVPGTVTGAATPCVGSTQTYSIAAVSTATGYVWTLPPGWTGTSTTNTITVIVGTNSGNIAVAASNGCGSSAANTKAVAPIAMETPTIAISSNAPTTLCSGTLLTFTATATHGGTNPMYQWKLNNINIGSNSATFSHTPVNGDVISCSLLSNYPCLSSNNITSNSLTMDVTESVTPSLNIYVPENHICSGTPVTFLATPTHGGTAPAYQWKLNNINTGTNSVNYTYMPNDGDVVTCIMTSNAVCATSATTLSNVVPMTIVATTQPTVSITANPGTQVANGQTITFTAQLSGTGGEPYQLTWYRNNVPVQGVSGTTYSVLAGTTIFNNNTVKARLLSLSPCAVPDSAWSNSMKIAVGTTSVGNVDIPDGFKLYPNPTQSTIQIEGLKLGDGVALYDALGRKLQSNTVQHPGAYTLDLSEYVPALYFIHFRNKEDKTWRVKVNKQ